MWAVFLDYEYNGKLNCIVLGGSMNESVEEPEELLRLISFDEAVEQGGIYMWEVDEDRLPHGYSYQTYYVGSYDPNLPMIGVA